MKSLHAFAGIWIVKGNTTQTIHSYPYHNIHYITETAYINIHIGIENIRALANARFSSGKPPYISMPIIRLCLGPTYAWRHRRCQRPNVRSTCLQKDINGSLIYTSWTHGDPWTFLINTCAAWMLLHPYNGIIPGVTPTCSNRFLPSIGWSKDTMPLFDAVHCARIRYIIRLNEASDMTMLMIICATNQRRLAFAHINYHFLASSYRCRLIKSWLEIQNSYMIQWDSISTHPPFPRTHSSVCPSYYRVSLHVRANECYRCGVGNDPSPAWNSLSGTYMKYK